MCLYLMYSDASSMEAGDLHVENQDIYIYFELESGARDGLRLASPGKFVYLC